MNEYSAASQELGDDVRRPCRQIFRVDAYLLHCCNASLKKVPCAISVKSERHRRSLVQSEQGSASMEQTM